MIQSLLLQAEWTALGACYPKFEFEPCFMLPVACGPGKVVEHVWSARLWNMLPGRGVARGMDIRSQILFGFRIYKSHFGRGIRPSFFAIGTDDQVYHLLCVMLPDPIPCPHPRVTCYLSIPSPRCSPCWKVAHASPREGDWLFSLVLIPCV